MKNFITLLFLLFFGGLFGQIALISPTGDGGFETGTTVATNNWVLVSSGTMSRWGIGTTPKSAGNRALVIMNTSNVYGYQSNTSSRTHIYRDVAIPAGATNITLSFKVYGGGDLFSGSYYDKTLVYHAPTSFTPTTSAPVSPTNTLSGATLLWAQAASWTTTWNTQSVTIPNSFAGTTRRIIFTWHNDASTAVTGGAVDEISLTYTPLSPPSCVGSPTSPANGQTPTLLNQQLSWPSVSGATGYDVFFGTSPTPPQVSTNQAGTTYNPGSLSPSTTYYWRIVPRNSAGSATGCSTWSFTTGLAGCLTATNGLWPSTTYTPTCNGIPNTITSESWTGEYSNVNVVSGEQYTFASSVSTDYITISNSTSTVILASGITPVVWTSNVTGLIRFYRHNNSSCGSSQVDRTITVQCGVEPEPGPCLNTTLYVTGPLPTRESPTIESLCNAGFGQLSTEYSQWTGGIANTSYTISSSISTDWLTVRRNTFSGTVVEYGQTPLTFEAPGNDTYFIHVNTNGFCGTDGSTCRNITINRISALPVELKDFYGKQYKNDNLIFWSTSSEKNSSHFIVESSTDGEKWKEFSKINAAGNSQILINYSLIDYDIKTTKYYKLIQYDFDGTKNEYDPIVIIRDFKNKVIKYLNVLGQEVNIENHFGVYFMIYADGTIEKKIKY